MKARSYSLLILITSLLSLAVQSLQDAPKLETKYYIELPETFINTLQQDQHGHANLWHPRLTLTKVHSLKDKTSLAELGSKNEKLKKESPNFLSFLQVGQNNQNSQGLVFIPGKQGNGSAIQSSKMDCECRFVKDPNSISLIMQSQGMSLQSENEKSSGTASALIETQDQESNLLQKSDVEVKDKLSSGSERTLEDDETEKLLELLREKKRTQKEENLNDQIAKLKEEERKEKLMALLDQDDLTKNKSEDEDLIQLLEEKNKLKKKREEEALLEELRRKKDADDLDKKLKELEKTLLVEKLEKELKKQKEAEEEKRRLKEEILAEIGQKEPKHKDHLRDELLLLLEASDSESTKSKYDDSDDDFNSYYQKYKQYKSLLSVQNQKNKNRVREQDDGDALQDYKLLQKIKSIENKSLRNELIEALL